VRARWRTRFRVSQWEPSRPALLIEATHRAQLAEGLLQALFLEGHALKNATDTELYVRDDGRGNSLVIPEPAPRAFVATLMTVLPGAVLLPVDMDEVPVRRVMRVGRGGVKLFPGSETIAPEETPSQA
jgi:hypothetical protein